MVDFVRNREVTRPNEFESCMHQNCAKLIAPELPKKFAAYVLYKERRVAEIDIKVMPRLFWHALPHTRRQGAILLQFLPHREALPLIDINYEISC